MKGLLLTTTTNIVLMIITVLLSILLCGGIIFSGIDRSKTSTYIKSLIDTIDGLNRQKEELNKQKDELNEQVAQSSIELNKIKGDQDNLQRLNELIEQKNSELKIISTNAAMIGAQEKEKLINLNQLEEKVAANRQAQTELIAAVGELKKQLIEYQTLHAAAIEAQRKEEDGITGGGELIPNAKQNEFIRLVRTITENEEYAKYTMLVRELRKAEGSVVWLPLVQKLCLREGLDRGGIYRLVLKADESVCYIGQAVNIKERGYTHIKKMLGIEAKGMERLYEDDFGPGDFRGEVLEFKDGDLTEDERYWMDWFKSREIGLNKKR